MKTEIAIRKEAMAMAIQLGLNREFPIDQTIEHAELIHEFLNKKTINIKKINFSGMSDEEVRDIDAFSFNEWLSRQPKEELYEVMKIGMKKWLEINWRSAIKKKSGKNKD